MCLGPVVRTVGPLQGLSARGKFAGKWGSIYTAESGLLPPQPDQDSLPPEIIHMRITFFLPLMRTISAAVLLIVTPSLLHAQDILNSADPHFAPGVLTTIPPDLNREDTVSVRDMVEIRANTKLEREPFSTTKSRTLFEMANSLHFRRDIWCLELSFKPLRMTYVDIPQTSGKMQRKLVWYLVYRIRNTGAGLVPQQQADGTFATQEGSQVELQFVPQFLLTSQDRDRQGTPVRKAYLDRILPAAIPVIQQREMPQGTLLNSAQIAKVVLSPESGRVVSGVWGVAIWEDVDPEIDFFSVRVGGLTNAYQWQDLPGEYRLGDPPGKGRRLLHRKLQLNFWRPGDSYAEEEREIRYGPAPGKADLYGVGEGVAYQWIYR